MLANVKRRRFEVEYQSVGNRGKYDLQVYTDAGWQEVRASRGGETDEGVLLSPGRGYRWTLEIRETDGDLTDRAGDERFPLRAGLPTGRYRFVYWTCDAPLAVAFDLVG